MARDGIGLYRHKGAEQWVFKFKDPQSGKWREKSTGQTGKREAWAVKTKFMEDLQAGRLPTETASWTLKAATEHWLAYRRSTMAEKTAGTEKRFMRQVLKIFGEGRILKNITLQDLRSYQMHRRNCLVKRTGQPVHPRTINLELLCLSQILQDAGLWSRFRDQYKPLKVPKTMVGRVLTSDEANRLMKTAEDHPEWFVAFWASVLAHATGTRGCEIKTLQLKDIHLDADVPWIRIGKSKTDAGIRDVPLNATAVAAVRKLVERAHILGAVDPEHYLLPLNDSKRTRKYDPLKGKRGYDFTKHQSSWAKAWGALRKAAGVQGYRFHDNRHSFITSMAEAGVPLEVTRSIVGHMSNDMVLRYTHVQSKAKEKAVKQLETDHALFADAVSSTAQVQAPTA
jgi:integrase